MSWRVDVEATLGTLELELELRGDTGPVALIGPNGSGKTSLLRILAGAHRPQRAEIEVAGTTLVSTRAGVELPSEARGIGYVPQGYGLFPHLRVVDNVAFGLATRLRRQPRAARRRAALEMLEQLDCGHLADRMPARLSGGEQQRVALARALILEPRMLLLDEPLAALDVGARRSVRSLLAARLRELACPSLVVTHDLRDLPALGAHVYVLEAGRIIQSGSLEQLRAAPASAFVAEFVDAS